MPHQARHSGFTIIELMITIAVIAVIAALALPSFKSILEERRLVGAAENLYASLQYARSEAIKRNSVMNFVVDNANPSTWCYGVDDDEDDCDCSATACEVGGTQQNFSSSDFKDIRLVQADNIEFEPRQGMPDSEQTYTLQIGNDGNRQRSVIVNLAGNIRVVQ